MLTSAQVVAFVLFDIAVIVVVARACGALARKVGQPTVVGEIIAGVLLGPTIFGATLWGVWDGAPAFLNCAAALPEGADPTITACLFPPQAQSILNALGQIALMLFMFLAGLELDFGQLKGKWGAITTVSLGVTAVPIALAFAVLPVMYTSTFVPGVDTPDAPSRVAFGLIIAGFMALTALPVLVRILQEKGLATSDLGAVSITAASIVTVLTFLLVAVAAAVATGAGGSAILTKVAATAAYIGVMLFVVKPLLRKPLTERYLQRARAQGLINPKQTLSGLNEFSPAGAGHAMSHAMFAWIIVLVLVSAAVAHVIGITVIVGGFMAGVVLPARSGLIRDMTVETFDFTVILLLPIFLAFSGLRTDVTQFSMAAVPGLLVFLAASVVSKWGSGIVFGRAAGLPLQDANAMGVLMNCRGLLPLVVGLIGLEAGVITPVMQVAGVIMALVTTGMTGPLFTRFYKPAPAAAPTPPAPAVR